MKKLFLSSALILMLAGVSNAEPVTVKEITSKLPPLNQGIAYSMVDNKLNYLGTIDVVNWKALTLEVGYAGAADNTGNKLVAVASIKLLDLGNVVNFPILDKVVFRPGIYFGAGDIGNTDFDSSETDWGVSATVLSLKF